MKKKEIYKDVIGYAGLYKVSNLGNVKSFHRSINGKILKPCVDASGYYGVMLCDKKQQKSTRIHLLVAITFLNHIPCGHLRQIDHINRIKTDNRVENLQILTTLEHNTKDGVKGLSKYRGVSWERIKSRWRSTIYIKGKRTHLGYYKKEEEAHIAYQSALKKFIKEQEDEK